MTIPALKKIWAKRGVKRLFNELEWREKEIQKTRDQLKRQLREKAALVNYMDACFPMRTYDE